MEGNKVLIKDILSTKELRIVAVKSNEIDAFIMGHHGYKTVWTPSIGEELCGVRESTNFMDKYVVVVQ